MNINDILVEKGNEVYSIDMRQSVHDAAAIMTEHSIGSILVMENDQILGILTRRNILHAIVKNSAIVTQSCVTDLMSGGVITCSPDDTIEHALYLMDRHHIRHLPVLDQGKLCGIVAKEDIMKASISAYQFENRLLKRYIQTWPDEQRGGGLKLVVNNKLPVATEARA